MIKIKKTIGGKLEEVIKLKKIKIMVLTLIVLLINTNIGLSAIPGPGSGPLTTVGLNNTVDITIPSGNRTVITKQFFVKEVS